MLHAMRRNAFLGGLVKFILYVLILVVAPLWIYTTYISPVMQGVVQKMNQVQGTETKAQDQFSAFANGWKQFESKLPGFLQAKQ